MKKQEYLNLTIEKLQKIISDKTFLNYKNQIIAQHIGVNFESTYHDDYLWNRALFLVSGGCFLFFSSGENELSFKSIKEGAEIYEYFSEQKVHTKYDKEYCLILSALCYDLTGYQANAFCLISKLKSYEIVSVTDATEPLDLVPDNYIITHIRYILLKKIVKAKNLINNNIENNGVKRFNDAISKFYNYVLNGENSDFLLDFEYAYKYFLFKGNTYISHLLYVLWARLKVSEDRFIWNFLDDPELELNYIRKKYIKLLTNDPYDDNKIKNIEDRVSKFELWTSQLKAIQNGLFSNENIVVQMPTSTGKTFIAELAILDALTKFPEKKCIYIAPFRALSNEKEKELSKNLSKLGFSVSAVLGSYELDEFDDVILDQTDVLITTPEKLDVLYRTKAEFFENLSIMVVDEGHIVGNLDSRSTLTELLISNLRRKFKDLRIIFISAVVSIESAKQFSRWVGNEEGKVIRSTIFEDKEEWVPTRKLVGNFVWNNNDKNQITFNKIGFNESFISSSSAPFVRNIIKPMELKLKNKIKKFPKESKGIKDKAETSAMLAYELSKEGNCLIFCSQPRLTKSVGNAMLRFFSFLDDIKISIIDYFQVNEQTESYFYALQWYGKDSYITKCIRHGVGIHFGDMAESVRRTVEEDYKNGKLRILISTNTIGQGLNFPIKNIIFHSTIIKADRDGIEKILVRDFWNIVGRAGRAGKETEGQIIFLINSETDARSYNEYVNLMKIESSHSVFFEILKAFTQNKISEHKMGEYVNHFSESFLLNLLMEDVENIEPIIDELIDKSLFKIQIADEKIDLNPLKKAFVSTVSLIQEKVEDKEMLYIFGKTGLTLQSNLIINKFIDENFASLKEAVESDNHLTLLKLILPIFDDEEIVEGKINLKIKAKELYEFIENWINGKSINKLKEIWILKNYNEDDMSLFLSKGLYYKFTWIINSFMFILAKKLEVEYKALPSNIKNLASFVKYGVNSEIACMSMSLGVKERDIANRIAFYNNRGDKKDFWHLFANTTAEEINQWELNPFEKKNILDTVLKLNYGGNKKIPIEFTFYVKGIQFEEKRIKTSFKIGSGEMLEYKRDEQNQYDPFAIQIFYKNEILGYVPRDLSKIIATEIDLNNKSYLIQVQDVVNIENKFNAVNVKMFEF